MKAEGTQSLNFDKDRSLRLILDEHFRITRLKKRGTQGSSGAGLRDSSLFPSNLQ